MTLAITQVKTTPPENHNIPSFMMQLPFRLIVIAPTSSGKSTMIHNLLSKPQFNYKQVFKNNIFLFSPSNNFDEVLDSLKIKDENKKDFMDEEFIENIMEEQKELIEKNNKSKAPHILMIFDDVVLQIKNTKENILKKIFFYGRKYKISCIITSQKYKALIPDYRLNASNYIYFLNVNSKEKQAIADDQAIEKKTFYQIWKIAEDDGQYSFIYVNLKEPIKSRYYINFLKRVNIKK
jgi:GTPase SAR1 family protein